MNQTKWDIAIVGGGAAGLMAAIGAAGCAIRQGHPLSVIVLDAAKRPGDKIYVTGNGRCNLTNLVQNSGCYYTDSGVEPLRLLRRHGMAWLIGFFEERGILLHERNGYVYPQTDQAATIAAVLCREARLSGVTIASGTRVRSVSYDSRMTADGRNPAGETRFRLRTEQGGMLSCRALVLCTGGKVGRSYGCCGDGYALAAVLGHTMTPLHPALCALVSDAPDLQRMAGVRVDGRIRLLADGRLLREERGSLQLTNYGISGIPVFNLSRLAGQALAEGRKVTAELNLLPETYTPCRAFQRHPQERRDAPGGNQEDKLAASSAAMPKAARREIPETGSAVDTARLLAERRIGQLDPDDLLRDAFLGVVNDKIASWLLLRHKLVPEQKVKKLGAPAAIRQILTPLFEELGQLTFPITGTRDYEDAQVTAGGIRLEELEPDTMASRCTKGLYLAGELLDADGICGGYNLTFAMGTGYTAGESAAEYLCSSCIRSESRAERQKR